MSFLLKMASDLDSLTLVGSAFHSGTTRMEKKFFLMSVRAVDDSRFRSYPVFFVAMWVVWPTSLNQLEKSTLSMPFSARSYFSLLSAKDDSPIFCSFSSYVFPVRPEIRLIALFCTCSKRSTSPTAHGYQAVTANSK